jgi:hypothetical protein
MSEILLIIKQNQEILIGDIDKVKEATSPEKRRECRLTNHATSAWATGKRKAEENVDNEYQAKKPKMIVSTFNAAVVVTDGKKITIAQALQDIRDQLLKQRGTVSLNCVTHPSFVQAEQTKFQNCMRFINQHWMDNDKGVITSKDSTEAEVKVACLNVQEHVMQELFKRDGKGNPSDPKARAKPNVMGFGQRVANLKKY